MKIYLFYLLPIFILVSCNNLKSDSKDFSSGEVKINGIVKGAQDGSFVILNYFLSNITSDTFIIKNEKFTILKEFTSPIFAEITYANFKDPVILEIGVMNYSIDTYPLLSGGNYYNHLLREAFSIENNEDLLYLIKQHPNSFPPIASVLYSYSLIPELYDINFLSNAYKISGDSVKNSIYGKKLKRIIDLSDSASGGKIIMAINSKDTLGNYFNMASLKGKYVLVDFWASWCPPCRKENKFLLKAYNQFHKEGLEIVSFSLDHIKEDWIKAINKDRLNWYNISDLDLNIRDKFLNYDIKALPNNYLLNPEGKIIGRGLKGDNINKLLEQVLE